MKKGKGYSENAQRAMRGRWRRTCKYGGGACGYRGIPMVAFGQGWLGLTVTVTEVMVLVLATVENWGFYASEREAMLPIGNWFLSTI
ncbi:sucrose-specific IIB component protein [Sesbania bispinosa]|nr:sucrose-specific IIB component protein [Sesbania bispinosa]